MTQFETMALEAEAQARLARDRRAARAPKPNTDRRRRLVKWLERAPLTTVELRNCEQ